MDKVLKEIKENELKIEELEKQRRDNNIKTEDTRNKSLEKSINALKTRIKYSEREKEYHNSKLEMIKTNKGVYVLLILMVIVAINLSFFFNMPIPRDMSIFYQFCFMITTTVGGSTILGTLISKKVLDLKIKSLDKDILDTTNELNEKTPLLEKVNKQIKSLEEKDIDLALEISKLEKRNDYLKSIRSEVIESFIKDNNELHLLINEEYNKSETEKQKVNKK